MKKWFSWAAVLLWMALIFFLSHQPGEKSGHLSSDITEILSGIIQFLFPFFQIELELLHFMIRKGAHFFSYLLLGVLVLNAMRRSGFISYWAAATSWGICLIYAITDEVHQLFIPGRSGEVQDVLIDSAGALTGIVIYLGVSFVVKRRRN
ncbi:VanZ family protein [Alkalihalobacillus sp. 1P02AB]|uniref:VanZ family protein n=1 Tax=Alkalihalobacillus sp. 1P02AB TaxID=3132260 RepID=UPI0039A5B392